MPPFLPDLPHLMLLLPLPLAALGMLFLAMVIAGRGFFPSTKRKTLRAAHWTEQNRAYWEYHLFGSTFRIFSAFLMGVVVVFLSMESGVDFPVPVIVLAVMLALLVSLPPQRRKTEELRKAWDRFDLSPFRGKLFIRLLFVLPLFLVLLGVALVPREWSWIAFGWIVAALLLLILWQARGGIWLSRRLGFLTPASSEWVELVEELAGEMKMEKLPKVWVADTAMLNAFALTTGHAVLFTQPLLDSLPREQVRALTAHEIGHLQEGPGSHFLRLIHPLVYLPIICLNPLIEHFDFAMGLLLALGGYLLATRLYMRFLRKAEFAADAAGPEECEETNRELAAALTTLYRENLVPAVLPQGGLKTHPDLYDRLLALGEDPDFERPGAPSSARSAALALLAVLACGLALIPIQILIWWIGGWSAF